VDTYALVSSDFTITLLIANCIVAECARSSDAGELALEQHNVRPTEGTASTDDT